MGRETKLTNEVQEKLVKLVAMGCFYEPAAAAAGIGRTTFWRWMQLGEDRTDDAGVLHRARPRYREFRDAITRARDEAEAAMTVQLKVHAREDWKACAFWLERARPKQWGRHDNLKVEADATVKHEHELTDGYSRALLDNPDGARIATELLALFAGAGLVPVDAGGHGVALQPRALGAGATPSGVEPAADGARDAAHPPAAGADAPAAWQEQPR